MPCKAIGRVRPGILNPRRVTGEAARLWSGLLLEYHPIDRSSHPSQPKGDGVRAVNQELSMTSTGQDIRLDTSLLAGTWRYFGSFMGRYAY